MLEEIIKELTATKNDDHIPSGAILAWAKRLEVQRAQAAVLNTLTESKQFDKIKISKKAQDDKQELQCTGPHSNNCTDTVGGSTSQRQCPAYGKMCVECGKVGHFWNVCNSRRSRVVNEMEQEVSQE